MEVTNFVAFDRMTKGICTYQYAEIRGFYLGITIDIGIVQHLLKVLL